MSRAPRAKEDGGAARDLVRRLAALGVAAGDRRCLVVGPEGLAEAVGSEWTPASVHGVVVNRSGSGLGDLTAGGADLVVTAGVLGVGTIGETIQTVGALVDALAPGGQMAAVIETFPTRVSEDGVGPDDLVLFPDLAATGHLGPAAEGRTPLTPAAWLALLAGTGLTVTATAGYGEAAPMSDTLERHAARLTPFERREIATGRLLVLAENVGGAS